MVGSDCRIRCSNGYSALHYVKRSRNKLLLVTVTLIAALMLVLFDIGWGPSLLSIHDVITAIIYPASIDIKTEVIVWDLRIPIALMALFSGAILGIAGAEMQTILNNPLADPFTLGISSAASFGAAIAIVFQVNLIPFAGDLLVTVNAFIAALASTFIIYAFTKIRGLTTETLVLVGIAMLFTFNALLSLIQYSASEVQLVQLVFWMMGSLARASWMKVAVCAGMIAIAIPFLMLRSWRLTALRMGDDKAESLGVNVKRIRIEMLIVVSLLSATAVSFVGTVAFIGLVGPHIARMIVGEDQRYFLPLSALAGGIIMSFASILSKIINPGVIYPIGIITSLIGIPFFVSLIIAAQRSRWQ